MACFIVPATEAVVTAIGAKILERYETKTVSEHNENSVVKAVKTPASRKLKWLTKLLAGGSAMLAFEHIWHGEVEPWFPFLTATRSPESTSVMLHEMATSGVAMALVVTLAWCGIVLGSHLIEKKAESQQAEEVR